jgi:hypothetical protein
MITVHDYDYKTKNRFDYTYNYDYMNSEIDYNNQLWQPLSTPTL